ncbi:MAG TPA: hypothetical protein DEF45_06095 [Rhodopirellula sp.]|nr:MAG: hypothetical protein CBD74_04245 [Saprospirales bacterium TMED214]HBV62577.1 hypothetical protein [Rhodopirellula sp.]
MSGLNRSSPDADRTATTNPPSRIRCNGVRVSPYQFPEAEITTVYEPSTLAKVNGDDQSSLLHRTQEHAAPRNGVLTRLRKYA